MCLYTPHLFVGLFALYVARLPTFTHNNIFALYTSTTIYRMSLALTLDRILVIGTESQRHRNAAKVGAVFSSSKVIASLHSACVRTLASFQASSIHKQTVANAKEHIGISLLENVDADYVEQK